MKYKVTYILKGKQFTSELIFDLQERAESFGAQVIRDGATFVAILRDSGGQDHPDNAGKFFLHRYLKA
jgi:hypothetical protein